MLYVCPVGLQLEHQQLRSLNPAQDGALIYKADLRSTLHDVMLYGLLATQCSWLSAGESRDVQAKQGVMDCQTDNRIH